MSENLTGAIKRLVRWVRFGTVRSEIKDTSNEVLGRVFGRPATAIGLRARSIGLKKSERFMVEGAGRIKPGQTPWNKGVKGSTGTQAGCRTTQY